MRPRTSSSRHIQLATVLVFLLGSISIGTATPALARDGGTIRFRRNSSSGVVTGTVRVDDIVTYRLSASEGQTMNIDISGPGVAVAVFDRYDALVGDQTRHFNEVLPITGPYTIEVIRLNRSGTGAYRMVVTIT